MMKSILWAAALAFGLKAAAVAEEARPGRDMIRLNDRQIEAGRFEIDNARPAKIARHIVVPGSIVPSGDHIARVAVRLLGTVAELRKQLGDAVRAGEVVAVIESREVADAKSEYLAARIVLDLQQTLFKRADMLHEQKVMSDNDFLRNRTTYEDARVKFETAKQKLFALNLTAEQIEALPEQPPESLRRQELRAPISGRIAERRVDLGGLVGREGLESELFVIVDPTVLWVDLAVPPAELAAIREGQRITIDGNRQRSEASVMFVSPLLDKDTRSARVVGSIDNSNQQWRPGMFVSADIPTEEIEAAVAVPKTALQTMEGSTVAFVRTSDGFAVRKLALGRHNAELVEVTQGLLAGERIATANTFVLKAELGKSEAED
jgi:cobalt-zinc-cadmium efflux system membrane fusion protein